VKTAIFDIEAAEVGKNSFRFQ